MYVVNKYISASTLVTPLIEVTVYPNISFAQLSILALVLPQNEGKLNKSVLPLIRVFKIDASKCWLCDSMKTIINFVSNIGVKISNNISSTLIHGVEKLGWTVVILLESLQHVLKMCTFSLSENQASIQLRCRLIGLFLKQSLFRKHDFDILVYKIYHDYPNVYFQHLKNF